MYTDIITHCTDTAAFLAEVESVDPSLVIKDESGTTVSVGFNKTRTVRNGTETVSIIRCTAEHLALIKSLTNINILVEVPAGDDLLAAITATKKKIYDRVYPATPIELVDDQQNVIGTEPAPALIGAFA